MDAPWWCACMQCDASTAALRRPLFAQCRCKYSQLTFLFTVQFYRVDVR